MVLCKQMCICKFLLLDHAQCRHYNYSPSTIKFHNVSSPLAGWIVWWPWSAITDTVPHHSITHRDLQRSYHPQRRGQTHPCVLSCNARPPCALYSECYDHRVAGPPLPEIGSYCMCVCVCVEGGGGTIVYRVCSEYGRELTLSERTVPTTLTHSLQSRQHSTRHPSLTEHYHHILASKPKTPLLTIMCTLPN